MNLPVLLSRALAPFGLGASAKAKAAEGAYRPGPYLLNDGWLPAEWGQYWNFWQLGYDPLPDGTAAIVEACVSAYAQTMAMLPGDHWRRLSNNGRELVTNSALARILRKPNTYQTPSDFMLNLVSSLYYDGNAYALATRNERFEVDELHWMHPHNSRGHVAEDGSVYYRLGGNPVIDARLRSNGMPLDLLSYVPARDVLHVKLKCPRTPLKGESPIMYAALQVASSNAIVRQTLAFYANLSRPSGTLNTPASLLPQQVEELRARWNEHAKGLNAGGVPILTNGLEFKPMSVSPVDSQLAEVMKLNDKAVAQVFRVPLAIVGDTEKAGFNTTEALMQFWLATGLGFCLNHVELAYDQLFRIERVAEYTEFDPDTLLRVMFKDRVDALGKGITTGLYAPNEARAKEELRRVENGDEPRVQQQMVPLSWEPKDPQPTPPASPPPEPEAEEEEAEEEPEAEQESIADLQRRIDHVRTQIAA